MLCRTLQHFNTSSDEYSVIFVSNCTAGLKLVAESFQFIEAHNSIVCDCPVVTEPADGRRQDGSVEEFLYLKSTNNDIISQQDEHFCTVPAAASDDTVDVDAYMNSSDSNDSVGCKHSKLPVRSCLWNGEPITKPTFLYVDDNHTSVIGMRGVIARHGAEFCCIHTDDVDAFLFSLQQSSVKPLSSQFIAQKRSHCLVNSDGAGDAVNTTSFHPILSDEPVSQKRSHRRVNCLLAYPAQSNFCGRRYPLEWADIVHHRSQRCDLHTVNKTRSCGESKTRPRWYVLLDAAALLTTSTLDLRHCKPDFVTVSFYKMFGFPTGLGMFSLCC